MNGLLRRATFFFVFLPGLAGAAQAQTASLVRDLNTSTP